MGETLGLFLVPFLGVTVVTELFFEELEAGGGDSESEKDTPPDLGGGDKASRSRENREVVPRAAEGGAGEENGCEEAS